MMYGGSLSSRRMRSRDDVSAEFCDMDLDHRLPTSTRGSLATAASRLAELGIRAGCYAGAEQVFSGACMASALEAAQCEITPGGSLVVTSRETGERTTFAWSNDRWRWAPYPGTNIEAVPRRLAGLVIIDFTACDRASQTPAGRFYLTPRSDR